MKKIFDFPRTCFALVIAMQTAFLINSRALWFSDEIRYANAYSNLTSMGKWVVLYLNGDPYPDKPPFYFWTVYIVQSISNLDIPSAMFLASAVTGFLYLLAHYYFSMTVTQDKKISLISGMILLSNFYFMGLLNYIRMDILFSALIILSFTFMYKFIMSSSPKYVYISYIVASFAALTKGPLACVLPVMFYFFAVIIFRQYRMLLNKHFYIGMAVTMVPILGWLLAIIAIEGYDFLADLIYTQVYKRAVDTWHHAEPFYYYTYALSLAWLPWVLIIFTSGFRELKDLSAGFFKRGRGEKYVIIAIVSTFVLLSMLSGKIAIYTLPIFSPIAIYFAWLFLRTNRRRVFWKAVSILFVLLAVVILFINFVPEVPPEVSGNIITGFASLIAAGFIWRISEKEALSSLLSFVLIITLFFNVMGLKLIPSLDIIMSPKKQATLMKEYIAEGYKPVAYKVYSGLYTFYAGSNVYETKDLNEVGEMLVSDKKIVVGMAEKHWRRWEERPEGMKIVDSQWVAGREYLLLLNK